MVERTERFSGPLQPAGDLRYAPDAWCASDPPRRAERALQAQGGWGRSVEEEIAASRASATSRSEERLRRERAVLRQSPLQGGDAISELAGLEELRRGEGA